jgi:hypothetical protein
MTSMRGTDGRQRSGTIWPFRFHVHSFRWAREDPFSPHNLYACRCGVVRHGL